MLDSNTIIALMGKFLIGTLIFFRVGAMFAAGPFFRNTAIPNTVKVFLSLLVSVMITSAYWTEQPFVDFHLWYLPVLVMKEILVGVALGYSANLLFYAARFAGGLIDMDMGYQTSLLFDKTSGTPTLIGEFYELIVLMLFIYMNGHHFLMEALFASLQAVPLTTFAVTDSTIELLIRFVTSILMMGIKMAAPILVSLFCTNLSLALLARVAPQTNIFILSFQLKVFVGVIILSVSVPMMVYVAKIGLGSFETEVMKIILSLNPLRV